MDFSKIDLSHNQEIARETLLTAAKLNLPNRREFEKVRNAVIKKHKGVIFHNLYFIKAYKDLVKEGALKPNSQLLELIQKRRVRTMSGVAPVTVLTKPFPCPGRCIYCPTDVRMPKSYIITQPAAQRGFRQQFDPYSQIFVRLKALSLTGHEVSKVELRVLGGTWSSYKKSYQTWFIKQCLLAMNEFPAQISKGVGDRVEEITKTQTIGQDTINTVILKPLNKSRQTFAEVVKANETAAVRCIGINIETRPDFITEAEARRLRKLGVTKVEIGVQTTDDAVQKLTKRGHSLAAVRKATAILRDAGFKISYHMMPNLPGSTVDIDKKMIADLFSDPAYQPDYLKIYPCMVIPETELSAWHKDGRYEPYDDQTLEDILYEQMKSVPEWCRVDRVARDIPADEIEAGLSRSNIRQILDVRAKKDGITFRDIRTREIAKEPLADDVKLITREYKASDGLEKFISYEDTKKDKLIALIRLRFPAKTFIKELRGAAIIREVHVYGQQIAIGDRKVDEQQHIGWGRKLMQAAETQAAQAGYKSVAVIAGIGTREYYKKLGYELRGTYMVKDL